MSVGLMNGGGGVGGGCARFKQNAWKRELCSNCYRPRDEHQTTPRRSSTFPLILPPTPLIPPSQSILKKGLGDPSKRKTKKSVNVTFHEEESEIIGFGGGGDDSDEEYDPEEEESANDSEGTECGGDTASSTGTSDDAEEERALKILTKNNTDFNSVLDNLNGRTANGGRLLLGHNQNQKLTVTVEPFRSAPPARSVLDSLLLNVAPAQPPLSVHQTLPDIVLPTVPTTVAAASCITSKEVTAISDARSVESTDVVQENKEDVLGGGIGVRTNPEGRKVHITRGTVITKSHEHAKNKLYIQNAVQRNKVAGEGEFNRTVIITGAPLEDEEEVEEEEEDNPQEVITKKAGSPKEEFLKSVLLPSGEDKSGEVTVKVLKLLEGGPAQSREMAGEPDGRAADSDQQESPPSTPVLVPLITPPPRTSFLHREANNTINSQVSPPLSDTKRTPQVECSGSEAGARSGKRPAPKPPASATEHPPTTPPPQDKAPPTPRLEKTPPRESPPREEAPQPPPSVKPPPPPTAAQYRPETPVERKKGSARMKVTLKKFLRLGPRDQDWSLRDRDSKSSPDPLPTPPRPRPLIVHPLDLNKSAVQVLPPSSQLSDKSPNSESPTSPMIISPAVSPTGRPSKPPPPPRSESLNLMERLRHNSNSMDGHYANLGGEGATSPVKPQRNGSLKEHMNGSQLVDQQQLSSAAVTNSGASIAGSRQEETSPVPPVQCVPDDDASITFCYGSETESDIYCPTAALNINGVFDDPKARSKTKEKPEEVQRAGFEDNYNAIVAANRQALLHLSNQVWSAKEEAPEVLRARSGGPLCWADFVVPEPTERRILNGVSFLKAEHRGHPLTLAVHGHDETTRLPPGVGPVYAKFKDRLPPYICSTTDTSSRHMFMSISVVKRLKAETLGEFRKRSGTDSGALVLLHILEHALRQDVAASRHGYSLRDFIVVTRDNSAPAGCYLPAKDANAGRKSAEECAIEAAKLLVGEDSVAFRILRSRGGTLDQDTVDLLKCHLWGPPPGVAGRPQETAFWLHLQRATLIQDCLTSGVSQLHPQKLQFIASVDLDRLTALSARLSLYDTSSLA